MSAPTSPRRSIADLDVPLAEVVRDAKCLAAYREGQLAEQRHMVMDPSEPPLACEAPAVTR